jgi:hypothetical protein
MCQVQFSQIAQIATVLLNNINSLLFLTETDRVLCEVDEIFTHNVDCFQS